MADSAGGAVDRILREHGRSEVVELLAERLSGADLTSLLLHVTRERVGRLTPPDVLRRYQSDRFTVPGTTPYRRLRRAEDVLLTALPDACQMVTLSPVAPLGTHSVIGTVPQNNVVSTIRGTEVAADVTNGLALEAAVRRQELLCGDPRSSEVVRLGAFQRVLRAQRFAAPALTHFSLFGLVSAGRDTGDLRFERRCLVEHLRVMADAVKVAGGERAQFRLTALTPQHASLIEQARDALADRTGVRVLDDPGRTRGRGYYTGLCFKLHVPAADGEWLELADGGFLDWTQKLLGNHKERLLTTGLGVDRLALTLPDASGEGSLHTAAGTTETA